MPEKLIDLPIEEARAAKWRRGRELHGPVFIGHPIGHPLEELDEELLDAMNYAEEAARRGFPMAGIAEDLRDLCERTRAIYRAAPALPARHQGEGGGEIFGRFGV
jgi:hypothetical protein